MNMNHLANTGLRKEGRWHLQLKKCTENEAKMKNMDDQQSRIKRVYIGRDEGCINLKMRNY